MTGLKVHMGFMLAIVVQIISIVSIYFYGLSIVSIVIFLVGTLIALLSAIDSRKALGIHIYALISTFAGLIILAFMSIFRIIEVIILLLLVNYAVSFFTLSIAKQKRRKIPLMLPHTTKEKIKVGVEAEKIFRELEKEVKKSKKKTGKKKTSKKKKKTSKKKKAPKKKKIVSKKKKTVRRKR